MIPFLASIAAAASPAPLSFPSAPSAAELVGCPAVVSEIGMTGDVMVHGMQIKSARQPDGTYSMAGWFDEVAPLLSQPELTIANLETTIAGEEQEFTGYPRFNSPEDLLDRLKEAGVDLLQTVNNHSLDRGVLGVDRTLERIRERGFLHTGTFPTAEERERGEAKVVLPGDLDVAFLAYTYGFEGVASGDLRHRVNVIDPDLIARDVVLARDRGAELVIVGLHWGREYRHEPEPEMVTLAHGIVDAGADVVMGTHPHVLQPAEVRTLETADGGTRDALILYSLGNFVSNQRTPFRDGGVIVRLAVGHCEEGGRTWLEEVRFSPIWVDSRGEDGRLAYRVLPATDEACLLPGMTAADCEALRAFREHTATILPPDRFDWTPDPAGRRWLGALP